MDGSQKMINNKQWLYFTELKFEGQAVFFLHQEYE